MLIVSLILIAIILLLNLILFLELPQITSIEHRLCVIFPYRDRWKELQITAPRLDEFLRNQGISFKFIIVNQTDNFRFNRATLINIGSLESKRQACDYIAIHDVDIIPLNPELNYKYPGRDTLMHITSGKYHPIVRYDYKNYIGGVLIMTLEDFKNVNGMSNNFWGWGLEDDEFYLRLKEFKLAKKIMRPENLATNRSNTFLHLHNKKRDYKRGEYRKKKLQGRDRKSGLSDLEFTLKEQCKASIGNVKVTILNVQLFCNMRESFECIH